MGKRLFDLMASLLGLLLLGLPMLLLALAIRLDSPGPALFRQERVGRHGRVFRMHKFRTMRQATAPEGRAEDLLLTPAGDDRITRVGRWLRDRRLDEMPQLLDVLRGEMSLVGPRPEVPRYVEHYPEALRRQVLSVRPGLTDPAALAHRREGEWLAQADDPERFYVEQVLPNKLRMQAEYAAHASFTSDLAVLARTVGVLVGSRS